MLSRNLEQSLHRALAYANERRHEYATLEHLLLALTEDQDADPKTRSRPPASSGCSSGRRSTYKVPVVKK